MERRILRRLRAYKDVERISDFIAKDSPQAALRFVEQVEQSLQELAKFPSLGVEMVFNHADLSGIRCLPVTRFPSYLIYYFARTSSIEVVRILHGARDTTSELLRDTS
jgi:toxin ParE1/3/4